MQLIFSRTIPFVEGHCVTADRAPEAALFGDCAGSPIIFLAGSKQKPTKQGRAWDDR